MTHSITINPLRGISDDQIAIIVDFLNKGKGKYVYSIEMTDEQRHMHICLETQKRSDNITRSLKTILGMSKVGNEWKVMCRVTVHNNEQYLIGYVCKDGTWHSRGYNDVYIAQARLYYSETKMKTHDNKNIHLGNFDVEVENYCKANGLDCNQFDLCTYLGLMYISGDYKMNQFLYRHMKIPVTTLWELRRTKNSSLLKDYTKDLLILRLSS